LLVHSARPLLSAVLYGLLSLLLDEQCPGFAPLIWIAAKSDDFGVTQEAKEVAGAFAAGLLGQRHQSRFMSGLLIHVDLLICKGLRADFFLCLCCCSPA
jgi:hypothetical protein